MPAPKVAIVIPTANAAKEPAATAIARAQATTQHLGATVHVIESSGPGFRFSRSVNRGMNEAPDADAWVLLNDDCVMDEGWLEAMLDAARSHPDAGIVGAVLRFPNGRLQHAGGFMLEPWPFFAHYAGEAAPFHALRHMWKARRRQQPYFGHYHRLRARHRIDFVTGACMLITRACRGRIGDYDEDYEFSCEDVDYGLRCLASGQEVALALDARGEHVSRATGKSLQAQIERSVALFFQRWPTRKVREVTRRGGRRGHQHGAGAASCDCRA
ncbi:MAG: glycosyltransferase [Candidatus Thermoplasmatota archaeon]